MSRLGYYHFLRRPFEYINLSFVNLMQSLLEKISKLAQLAEEQGQKIFWKKEAEPNSTWRK
jgi:hypothetical protein